MSKLTRRYGACTPADGFAYWPAGADTVNSKLQIKRRAAAIDRGVSAGVKSCGRLQTSKEFFI
jgi:hypothetical protein